MLNASSLMKKVTWSLHLRNLHHHGAGQDEVIRELAGERTSAGKVDIDDTGQTLGYDAASSLLEGSELGTGRSRGEGAELSLADGLGLELDGSAGLDSLGILASSHGERGEGGDDEIASLGAARDERRGKGEDLLRGQRGVEGLGDGHDLCDGAGQGLVTRLDGENAAGCGEDLGVCDELGGSEVGRHADVLEDGGCAEHARGVGESKVVLASLYGLSTGLGEGSLEQNDVLLLRLANLLQVGYLLRGQSKGLEVCSRELGETLAVKGLFEQLESQSAGMVC